MLVKYAEFISKMVMYKMAGGLTSGFLGKIYRTMKPSMGAEARSAAERIRRGVEYGLHRSGKVLSPNNVKLTDEFKGAVDYIKKLPKYDRNELFRALRSGQIAKVSVDQLPKILSTLKGVA